MTRLIAATFVAALLFLPEAAFAQHDHGPMPPDEGWKWTVHGTLFLNLNMQDRRFRDFTQLESQNWGMVAVTRRGGRLQTTVRAMFSAEPWTLRRLGSAQVLQVGETLDGGPLLDYQHPHDFIMALEARLDWTVKDRTTAFLSVAPVGSVALGPGPFMHRASAGNSPTAPLSHHMLDSSHLTHGVASAGLARGEWTLDASVFRGREPDEDRVGFEKGALDSASGRLTWQRGPWRAQVSTGHLNEPEPIEPGDITRATASLEYEAAASNGRRTAWMAAWGRNDRSSHASTGWLLEGRQDVTTKDVIYGRGELVDRFILVDFDYAAETGLERRLPSSVAALTVGYQRTLATWTRTVVALGGDVTWHRVSANLRSSYGSPISWHVFLRLSAR